MKTLLYFSLFLIAFGISDLASGGEKSSHQVRSYTTRRGTTVETHRRTDPDRTTRNNWSARGNVNPHTGKRGTKR